MFKDLSTAQIRNLIANEQASDYLGNPTALWYNSCMTNRYFQLVPQLASVAPLIYPPGTVRCEFRLLRFAGEIDAPATHTEKPSDGS